MEVFILEGLRVYFVTQIVTSDASSAAQAGSRFGMGGALVVGLRVAQ